MGKRCLANTVNNTRCKNICIKDKVHCNCHEDMKQEIYGKYKDSCKKVWSIPCTKEYLSTLSEEEIKTMIVDMNKCSRLRCTFAKKCCDNSIDLKHLGAIEKIEKNMCKCFKVLEEMNPILYHKKPNSWCSVYEKSTKPKIEMTREQRAASSALGRARAKERQNLSNK